MNAMQRSLILAGAVAVALTLTGCGGDGDPCDENPLGPGCRQSPPPASPTPFPATVIFGTSGAVPADTGVSVDFSIPSAGTVTATVDWTFASSDVWIVMTTTDCDDFVAAFLGQCFQIGTANLGNSKPKTVSGTVTQATSARLWIANFALVDESMAVQITHARTGSTSAPVILELETGSWVAAPTASMRALRGFENEK